MTGYLAGGLALGVVLIIAHVCLERDAAQLESAAVLLISSVGISTGIKLLVICVTVSNLHPFGGEDRVYIFLGGLALIWVSAQAILGSFRADQP